jgi:nitronate monooxygenase
VAALALGAQGAAIGTRLLATAEARAHPRYKQKLVDATEAETVHTILFGYGWPHAPHRTLRTAFVEQWLGNEERGQESRPDEPVIGRTRIAGRDMPLLRFMGFPPNLDATGDLEAMDLLAGQGVGLITAIEPGGEVVREIAQEAARIIERLQALRAAPLSASAL